MKNVRNFWIKLKIDGRETMIETGPRSKDGGFEMTIGMRDKNGGVSENKLKINGFAEVINDKKRDLRIEVDYKDDNTLYYENE
jgi:hypothetical protein